jgi:hypothetical protein
VIEIERIFLIIIINNILTSKHLCEMAKTNSFDPIEYYSYVLTYEIEKREREREKKN